MRGVLLCALALIASATQAGVAPGDGPIVIGAMAPFEVSDLQANAFFGQAIASEGLYAAIGSPGRAEPAAFQGRVTIFRREMVGWRPHAHLLAPSTPAAQDRFGAALSMHNGWLAVGRPGREAGAVVNAGSVHLYGLIGTQWNHVAEIFSPATGADDEFGTSVALSGDVLVVGAPNDDIGASANRGSAYVYRLLAGSWTLVATLTAPDGAAADLFGLAVDISGGRIVVGAPGHATGGLNARGAAYLFETPDNSIWNFVASFVPADTAAGDLYGTSVSIDGDNFVVGAPFHDPAGVANQGAAYAYHRATNNTWSQTIKFLTGNIVPNTTQARFGTVVTMEGTRCAVGAPYADSGGVSTNGRGAVWHYLTTDGGLNWVEAGNPVRGGMVGALMGVPELNGNTLFAGAPFEGLNDEGSVTIVEFLPTGPTSAIVADVLGAGNDQFGSAVALNRRSNPAELAIGAPSDDISPQSPLPGSVRVYRRPFELSWAVSLIAPPPNITSGDGLGSALDFDGDLLLVGAPLADVGGFLDQGAAYVFVRPAIGIVWNALPSIVDAPVQSNANYGASVALDVNFVAVGAPRRTIGTHADQGLVQFRNCGAPLCDTDEGVVFANGQPGDRFGHDIDIDAGMMVVGAPFWDIAGTAQAGSAFVLVRNATNTGWTQLAQLTASDAEGGDNFGYQVAIDASRQVVAVTATGKNFGSTIDAGAIYVFERRDGVWRQHGPITIPGIPGLRLGTQLALHEDRLLVTAERYAGTTGANTGRAYLFERMDGVWALRYAIDAPEPQAGGRFGAGADLSLYDAAIGAPDWRNSVDLGEQTEGRAYVFRAVGYVVFRDDFEL